MSLTTFLAQDRLRAVAGGQTLPDRTMGSVLFADISGFTPLTEALHRVLGPRQGAEVLSDHLEVVYRRLISEVERFWGSVISFAGDAITCLFDGAGSANRAAAAAVGMQNGMLAFSAFQLPGDVLLGEAALEPLAGAAAIEE